MKISILILLYLFSFILLLLPFTVTKFLYSLPLFSLLLPHSQHPIHFCLLWPITDCPPASDCSAFCGLPHRLSHCQCRHSAWLGLLPFFSLSTFLYNLSLWVLFTHTLLLHLYGLLYNFILNLSFLLYILHYIPPVLFLLYKTPLV